MNVTTDSWLTITFEWATYHRFYALVVVLIVGGVVSLAGWLALTAARVAFGDLRTLGRALARHLARVGSPWQRPQYAALTQPTRERCELTRFEREALSVIAAKYELTQGADPLPILPRPRRSPAMRRLARACRNPRRAALRVRALTNTRGGHQ